MSDKSICRHLEVKRRISMDSDDYWTCEECGAKFYHLEDIGFPGQHLTVMEPYATLRDQFAMAALMGLLASGRRDTSVEMIHENVPAAYKYADSMLEVRK